MRWKIKIDSGLRKFSFEIDVIYNVIHKNQFHWREPIHGALNVAPKAYFQADFWQAAGKKSKLVCFGTDDDGFDYVAIEMEAFSSLLSIGSGNGQVPRSGGRDCPVGPITWTILQRT
jgi:hypothetical protein